MTLMLELSPDVEARLRRKAEQAGQSLPDYLLAIAEAEEEETDTSAGSAADLFAGRIGRIKGSTEAFSQDCGQRFTEYVVEKHKAGNL